MKYNMNLNDKLKNLISIEKNLISEFSQTNWFIYSVVYLDLADAGCVRWLTQKDKNNWLVIPIVYNVKHAMEITLKAFKRISSDEDVDKSHDLLKLFKNLKSVLKNKIKNKDNRKELSDILNKLEVLVYKYYGLFIIRQYFAEKMGVIFFEDFDNVLLKYPEKTQVNLIVNFKEVVNQIKTTDIEIIREDIKEITSLLTDFFNITKNLVEKS
jgi:hypothetical protein